MNHITQEQAWVFACNFLPTEAAQALGPAEAQVICNAAIEWHIAQQVALQHEPENEPAVSLASQAAPKEPLTDEQCDKVLQRIDEWATGYGAQEYGLPLFWMPNRARDVLREALGEKA